MAVVTVPVVGKVDQRWLYAGGATIAGIVAYAWWTGSSEPEPGLLPAPETEFEPPTVVDSNLDFRERDEPTPGMPESNVEWLSMAREQGAALGFADTLVTTALQKYLAKQPLTVGEAAAVSAIVAILGTPPSGSYPLIPTLPPTNPPHVPPTTPPSTPTKVLGPPSSVRASGGRATLVASWSGVPGATGYQVRFVRGYPQGTGGTWVSVSASARSHRFTQRVTRRSTYTVEVRTRNRAGVGKSRRSRPTTVRP